jgi:hypothetical protein
MITTSTMVKRSLSSKGRVTSTGGKATYMDFYPEIHNEITDALYMSVAGLWPRELVSYVVHDRVGKRVLSAICSDDFNEMITESDSPSALENPNFNRHKVLFGMVAQEIKLTEDNLDISMIVSNRKMVFAIDPESTTEWTKIFNQEFLRIADGDKKIALAITESDLDEPELVAKYLSEVYSVSIDPFLDNCTIFGAAMTKKLGLKTGMKPVNGKLPEPSNLKKIGNATHQEMFTLMYNNRDLKRALRNIEVDFDITGMLIGFLTSRSDKFHNAQDLDATFNRALLRSRTQMLEVVNDLTISSKPVIVRKRVVYTSNTSPVSHDTLATFNKREANLQFADYCSDPVDTLNGTEFPLGVSMITSSLPDVANPNANWMTQSPAAINLDLEMKMRHNTNLKLKLADKIDWTEALSQWKMGIRAETPLTGQLSMSSFWGQLSASYNPTVFTIAAIPYTLPSAYTMHKVGMLFQATTPYYWETGSSENQNAFAFDKFWSTDEHLRSELEQITANWLGFLKVNFISKEEDQTFRAKSTTGLEFLLGLGRRFTSGTQYLKYMTTAASITGKPLPFSVRDLVIHEDYIPFLKKMAKDIERQLQIDIAPAQIKNLKTLLGGKNPSVPSQNWINSYTTLKDLFSRLTVEQACVVIHHFLGGK